MRHELAAVADAEDGDAEGEDLGGVVRRRGVVDAVGSSRKDDALRGDLFDPFKRYRVGQDLAVHIVLAHTAGDQLVVLTAEVEYDHGFLHSAPPL